jgi:hypothetical protein
VKLFFRFGGSNFSFTHFHCSAEHMEDLHELLGWHDPTNDLVQVSFFEVVCFFFLPSDVVSCFCSTDRKGPKGDESH